MINDKLGLELDYEQSINEPTNIHEVKLLGLNLTYKFLNFCIIRWRRGESNPRPRALGHWYYMHSL